MELILPQRPKPLNPYTNFYLTQTRGGFGVSLP